MESNPKSQVVERLKEAQNVLVTVSANPSVDQLSAAIGFTLLMNKLGKHATAVFSGHVPSTLEFLKPEETLEQNTDSLRDFIISLDKAKADKLRYKVEDEFVKIYITPYRTSLSEADLNFSQGDFNVDAVVALGVDQREHVDQAILEHGRILHDATVIGVMAGQGQTEVGSINWQDSSASSLCEMLVSISESFQSGLLDGQMATAFLTGIVAETDRFSNEKTSPKVMTMSAQLMAAGANQQLIATQLAPVVEADISGGDGDLPAPVMDDEQGSADEAVLDLHHEDDGFNQPQPEQQPDYATHEELAEAVNQVQENAYKPHRVIQPLPEEPEQEQPEMAEPEPQSYDEQPTSKYIMTPPASGGTLTANTQPEWYEPSSDPLTAADVAPSFPTQQHEKAVVEPLLGVTDDAESVQAASMPSTEDPLLPSDGETSTMPLPAEDPNAEIPAASDEVESDIPVIDKLGPEVHDNDTLDAIEHAVEDYSGTAPHTAVPEEPQAPEAPVEEAPAAPAEDSNLDTDAARQAVMDAVNAAGYDTNRPEPIQALNAQEFTSGPAPQATAPEVPSIPIPPSELDQGTPVQEQPADAPPSVPPPMMPQFPIPGAEVYEPDQEPRS